MQSFKFLLNCEGLEISTFDEGQDAIQKFSRSHISHCAVDKRVMTFPGMKINFVRSCYWQFIEKLTKDEVNSKGGTISRDYVLMLKCLQEF